MLEEVRELSQTPFIGQQSMFPKAVALMIFEELMTSLYELMGNTNIQNFAAARLCKNNFKSV